MGSHTTPITGCGLGLRRAIAAPLAGQPASLVESRVDFMEVAPENWMGIGGALGRQFRALTEAYPFLLHGLSLNIGGFAPLDEVFLRRLKQFIAEHGVRLYSEHLSSCADEGHLYDLMPLPFTEEAVHHVAARIRRVQEILEQRIAIENISYYSSVGGEGCEHDLGEAAFINAVLSEADCDLLLDVNNIYVNSINHGYDAAAFLQAMPAERLAYLHVAGHYREAADIIIDTHGAPVVDPVWQLLETTYDHFGVIPTLLERDFNLPPVGELLDEVATIGHYQRKWSDHHEQRTIQG